jgi:hypothetical protein
MQTLTKTLFWSVAGTGFNNYGLPYWKDPICSSNLTLELGIILK